MTDLLRIGLDVGSTTVKIVVLDEEGRILYNRYQRHYSYIRRSIYEVLNAALEHYRGREAAVMITGSGGMLVSEWLDLPFVQEVVASTEAVRQLIPQTSVAIELGGEDAKITFFENPVEQRMNGRKSIPQSIPLPRAAAYLPKRIFSPCLTRAPRKKILRRLYFNLW